MNKNPAIELGGFLVWLGIICFCYFFFCFDTSVSVPAEYYPDVGGIWGGRVNNLGLMQDRELGCIAGIAMFGIGSLLFITKVRRNTSPKISVYKQPVNWGAYLIKSIVILLSIVAFVHSAVFEGLRKIPGETVLLVHSFFKSKEVPWPQHILTPTASEYTSSPPPQQGSTIVIKEPTNLYFQNQFYRVAQPGEEFQVYEYRPNEKRLYILSKDANGNPIGLNIPDQ